MRGNTFDQRIPNSRRLKTVILFSCLCLCALTATIAQPSAELQHYRSLYGSSDAVFINNSRTVTITLQQDSFTIYQEDAEDLMLLGNNVNRYAESSVGYSDFIPLLRLDAKTLVPEKNKYRTEPVRDMVTEKSITGSIFYDDYKEKKIYFNALQPGARRIVNSWQQVKMPQLLPPFFFQSYAPCEVSYCEISVPANVELGYNLFNVPEGAVRFTVSENGGNKIYRWEYDKVPALTFVDDDAPGIRSFMPHLVVRIAGYRKDDQTIPMLSTTEDLYRWYYGFLKSSGNKSSDELKMIVDSLVKGAKTDEEKAAKIFTWVQDHIRYVAFEAGLQGFIPRSAATVCSKRYGDCKDMATIVTTMLREAKLDACPAWIGTRDIPYTYEEVPSPISDNHMIAVLRLNRKSFFLDATSNYLAYDYPSSFIQGKEALISVDSTHFLIEKVPVVDAARNLMADSFFLRIDNGMLKGHGTKLLSGYARQNFEYFLSGLQNENRRKAMEGKLTVGNNKFRLDSFTVSHQDSNMKPLRVNSDFTIADYVQQAGDEIYVNLNLQRPYYNDFLDTTQRQLDREIEYETQVTQHYELKIPEGYSVEYLPAAARYHDDDFGFEVSCSQQKDKIILNKRMEVATLLLKRSTFSDWNKMIAALNSVYNEAIILKKKP